MANAMLGLRAETSIHAGTGQNTGVIDLPIQREAHTGWPCVFGSAMKGTLRAHAETRIDPKPGWIKAVFGPDTDKASDHAGAIAITDARLLLLPIRSLTGHFKWVTCPAVLERLRRDMELIGGKGEFPPPKPEPEQVISCEGGEPLFLEEFQFQQKAGVPDKLITGLGKFGLEETALREQLVIMHNDDFADFCNTATAITPHIAIENETKTVVGGALWYEETLPPDTLLYTMLMASKARNGNGNMDAATVLGHVTGMFTGDSHYLQVGGNETVGMGWCKVKEVAL